MSILTTLEHEVGRRPPCDTDPAHCQRIFGDTPSRVRDLRGAFLQPTILTDATPQTPTWTQETIGRVSPVTRFSDPE